MKKYKFRLVSNKILIEQIKNNAEKLKQTRTYIEYTTDSILDLFKKIKQLNIELSKLEVEPKSLKHDTYEIKDVQKDKEEERSKLNRVLEAGLNDFIFKIDILLDDIKTIYLDSLTLLYRKYKELVNSMSAIKPDQKDAINKIELLREQIKNIARGIYETAAAKEETIITKDVFEKRKTEIAEKIKKEILETAKLEKINPSVGNLKQISKELKSIQDIEFDISVLVPKIEEIIPKIDSETYLLENHTEEKINKDISSIKKKIEQVKFLINDQARSLYEDIKIV